MSREENPQAEKSEIVERVPESSLAGSDVGGRTTVLTDGGDTMSAAQRAAQVANPDAAASGDQAAPEPNVPLVELRIALAMCGGIALTLYEAGVAHEIYNFYKAFDDPKSPYHPALDQYRIRPVIDILTGASAGGINSVMLGSCVANGHDFANFHETWIKEPDIGELRYPPGTPSIGSILDTKKLEGALSDELKASMASPEAAKTADSDVDLIVRLCRTDAYSHDVDVIDAIGQEIAVQDKSDVIGFETHHFRSRGQGSDKEDTAQIHELTQAALATSAFPLAFPPVDDAEDRRWYVDGGLWDNQPIDLAVQEIRGKPAFGLTHRCVFFVDPDPTIAAATAGPMPPCPSQPRVLSSLPFMGIKGNILPALDDILEFNQKDRLYRQLIDDTRLDLATYGRKQLELSDDQITNPIGKIGAGALPTADDEPTLLNKIRIHKILFDDDPALIARWYRTLARADFAAPGPAQAKSVAVHAWRGAVAALKYLQYIDLEQWIVEQRIARQCARMKAVYSARKNTQPKLLGRRAKAKAALYLRLEELRHFLYTDREIPFGPAGAPANSNSPYRLKVSKDTSRFRSASVAMLDAIAKMPAAGAPAAINAWVAKVARIAERAQASSPRPGSTKTEELFQKHPYWKSELANAPTAIRSHPLPIAPNLPSTRQAESIGHFILAAISDLEGKDTIDLVRISPNDADNTYLIPPQPANNGKSGAEIKLAGRGLGHMQGFFEREWRLNDYIWGRLDAAEVLLRTLEFYGLQHPGEETLPAARLPNVQQTILQDEAKIEAQRVSRPYACDSYVTITENGNSLKYSLESAPASPARARVQEENKLLIGFGGKSVFEAKEPGFSDNIDYLAHALVKLIRSSSPNLASLFSFVPTLTRLYWRLVKLILRFNRSGSSALSVWRRARTWCIALVVLLLIGAILIFIGWHWYHSPK